MLSNSAKKNDFSFLLTEKQRLIIANLVNNEILCWANGIQEAKQGDAVDELSAEESDDFDKMERRLLGKKVANELRKKEQKEREEKEKNT